MTVKRAVLVAILFLVLAVGACNWLSRPERLGTQSHALSSTLQISGRDILDACGNRLLIRGVEQPVAQPFIAYDPNDAGTINNTFEVTLDNIAQTGANAVRLLFDVTGGENGENPNTRVAQIVDYATNTKGLVVYLTAGSSNWPCTARPGGYFGWGPGKGDGGGYGYDAGATPCSATDGGWPSYHDAYLAWFFQPAIKQMVDQHGRMIIVDVVTEGASDDWEAWRRDSKADIAAFRDAGYTVPFTVIGPNYGRDLPAILHYGDDIVDAGDPLHKTILGWQAYWGDNLWYQNAYAGLEGLAYPTTSIVDGMNVASRKTYPIQTGLDWHADLSIVTSEYDAGISAAAQTNTNWLWWAYNHPLEWPVWQNHLTEHGYIYQLSDWPCNNCVGDPKCSDICRIPYARTVIYDNPNGLHSAVRACNP